MKLFDQGKHEETPNNEFPPEIISEIFSKLSLHSPVVTLITHEATLKQQAEVVKCQVYHVIKGVDCDGESLYFLGFAKKSEGDKQCIEYATVPLSKDRVFYNLFLQEPSRLDTIVSSQGAQDQYAIYFLERAIRNASGIVYSAQDRIRLAGVCVESRRWMNPSQELFSLGFQQTIQDQQCEITLQHVLFGDQDAAYTQVLKNPTLLLKRNTNSVADLTGKLCLELTLFQAALCAGDIELCEAIKHVFIEHIPDGKAILQEQFAEIFPAGVAKCIEKQKQAVFHFDGIIQAIVNASNQEVENALNKVDDGTQLYEALKKFRKEFAEKSYQEKIFNPYHLLTAFRSTAKIHDVVYERNHQEYLEEEHAAKENLFLRQVLGFVQRHLPAFSMQAFVGNLLRVTELKKPVSRTFCFAIKTRLNFDALALTSVSSGVGLGFDYWITKEGYPADCFQKSRVNLEIFYKQIQQRLQDLCVEGHAHCPGA